MVASVSELYNKADASWGCSSNGVCGDTVISSNGITAGITLLDRVPRLAAWLTPVSPIPVPYCDGATATLHITNDASTSVGTAYSVIISNMMPAGWTGTSSIVVGDLPRGASTNIAVSMMPDACPISTNLQMTYFSFNYRDAMNRVYGPPTVYTAVQVVAPPAASVRLSAPSSQVSTNGGVIPVFAYLSYSNLVGTENIVIHDLYPASTNLTVSNISAGGYISGGTIIWTNSGFIGSGIYTARFDLVIGETCGGPVGSLANTVTVPDFYDCHGCVTPVGGSGGTFYTYLYAGVGCSSGGSGGSGGTGGSGGGSDTCAYVSYVVSTTDLAEVCQPVSLTHFFTNFSSSLSGWSNVVFTSDLGGGQNGDLTSSNDVVVLFNGTDLTAFCRVSNVTDRLSINLSGLSNSLYSSLSNVTSLAISWKMETFQPGRVVETSALVMPGVCGTASATAFWNVGASVMSVSLSTIQYLEACGVATGRIDLAQFASPGLMSGTNGIFPSYGVKVTLNLDADADSSTAISYEPGSTVFSNMVLLTGDSTNGFDPVVTNRQLVWTIGDLSPQGAGVITYILRGGCTRTAPEKQAAKVEYTTRCGTTNLVANSSTNQLPMLAPSGSLSVDIQPEVTFLTDTQYMVRISFMNTGAGTAYNVKPELVFPSNVVFGGASVNPSSITPTGVVWTLQSVSNPGDLINADPDGMADDLRPLGQFYIDVTNNIVSFGQNAIQAAVSHGCNSNPCQSAVSGVATFESNEGALSAITGFPANGKLCNTNAVLVLISNTGLTKDYNININEVLPPGISYVSGSSRYAYGATTNSALDPVITSSNLTWTSAQVSLLAGLPAGTNMTILFSTLASCASQSGSRSYQASASYVSIGGTVRPVPAVTSIQGLDQPAPTLRVDASNIVVDFNRTNIYTIVLTNSSAVGIPAMMLEDVFPSNVTYLGASIPPDLLTGSVAAGQLLVWSNSTMMELGGDAPYQRGSPGISISITGLVGACNYLYNTATVHFGCDEDSLCLSNRYTQTSISVPLLTVGNQSALSLSSWGGTRTVFLTNSGATARGIIVTNMAPTGFVFTANAVVSGEFTASTPIVHLSGSPSGSVAIIDFTSAASSGATDLFDDAGDGDSALDLGAGKGVSITFNLINDGSGMDTAANPLDWGYADPEPVLPSQVSSTTILVFSNWCEQLLPGTDSQTVSASPVRPDPDISLTPQSLIVTNGQRVDFEVSVINGADAGLTTNLHVRMKLGAGWSNLVCVSTQLIDCGTGALTLEMLGSTNVLVELPGFALNTTTSELKLDFQATALSGQGSLSILAEVVGVAPVLPAAASVYTNTLGALSLADTLHGINITSNGIHGAYYGFDQVQMSGAGFEISKTILYDNGSSSEYSQLNARIGEPLLFRIRASFFGTSYSNVVLTQSHESNLIFGTPRNAVCPGAITNYSYNAATGEFTLLPAVFDASSLASFLVDVPVFVTNAALNVTGTVISNSVIPSFSVVGMTNAPPGATNFAMVVEPDLVLGMTCDTNNVQAGDTVTLTNVISHTAQSTTNA